MNDRLSAATTRLYAVFERYPLAPIQACPCGCVSPKYVELLRTTPMRSLTEDQLASYAFRALGTMDGLPAWKHYLPRIFELCATSDGIQSEVAIGRLAEGRWREWPLEERGAIEEFMRAWWLSSLEKSADDFDPETLLCAAAKAGIDLGWFLDRWQELPAHVARFVAVRAVRLHRRRSLGFLFSEAAEQSVIDWLRGLPEFVIAGTEAEATLRWIKSPEFKP